MSQHHKIGDRRKIVYKPATPEQLFAFAETMNGRRAHRRQSV